jgi:hypothetical protein
VRIAPLLVAALAPSAALADGCPHPFMPFRVGATWLYRVGAAPSGHSITMRLRIEAVHKEAGAHGPAMTAELSSQMIDTSAAGERVLADVKQEYRCDAAGLHTNQPPPGGVTGPNGERMEIEVVDQRGVTLPPSDALHPGVTWTEEVTMRMALPGGKGPVKIERNARLQLAGAEPLAVAAGSFEAIRVVSKESLTMPGGAPETRQAEIWYGRNTGMLRARTSEGTLELLKFTPGK